MPVVLFEVRFELLVDLIVFFLNLRVVEHLHATLPSSYYDVQQFSARHDFIYFWVVNRDQVNFVLCLKAFEMSKSCDIQFFLFTLLSRLLF